MSGYLEVIDTHSQALDADDCEDDIGGKKIYLKSCRTKKADSKNDDADD